MHPWTALLWTAGHAAAGGLQVDAPTDCLQTEALDLEVRQALGDDVADRIDLAVAVTEPGGVDDQALEVTVRVAEEGRTLWERSLAVTRSDCPFLAPLVARSVERGLADLPGWGVEARARSAPRLEGALQVSVSGPGVVTGTFGPIGGVRLVGPLQLVAEASFRFTGVEEVEVPTDDGRLIQGGAQLVGPAAGVGPGVWVWAGDHSVRFAVTGGGFLAHLVGRDLPPGGARWFPQWVVRPTVTWGIAETPVRVGVTSELAARVVYRAGSGTSVGTPVLPEYRIGVHVGIGSISRRR